VVKIGEIVGGLSKKVALETGLREGIPVAGGGADAFVAVIGVNALQPGKLALITGSSQLLIGMTKAELHAPGIFGTYPSAIIPGMEVVEAGQISTGSIVKWWVSNFLSADLKQEAKQRGIGTYALLDEKAAHIPPGSEGLVVLEHWQGNRTPWVDANSRGVIRGLTLKHTPAHLFRAIMEGVSYGTAVILKRMASGGVFIDEIIACGGATKSDLWMQINADVMNKRIAIPEEQQATSLGSAIAATVASGIYGSLDEAAQKMVRIRKYIEPNPVHHAIYAEYVHQYEATYEHLKDDSKRLVSTLT
jgi:ribulose kinase